MAGSSFGIRAANAFVELKLRNRIEQGLRVAEKELTAFRDRTQAIGKALFAGGAAVGAPLLASTAAFAKAGDDLAKMSKRTGVELESLSQIDFVASQSGSSLETFENGLRRMQATVGDLTARTDIFDQFGIDIAALRDLDPEAQFLSIADSIASIEDPTKRAAAAQRLFGRSGTQLLPMLQLGADGIRQMKDQAADLDLTFSAEDAASAEALTDAYDVFGRTLKRISNAVGAALAPALESALRLFGDGAAVVSRWIDQNREVVVQGAALAAGLMLTGGALLSVATAAGVTAAVLPTVGTGLKLLFSPLGLINSLAGRASVSLIGIGKTVNPIRLVTGAVHGLAAAHKAMGAMTVGKSLAGLFAAALSPAGLLAITAGGIGFGLMQALGGTDALVGGLNGLYAEGSAVFGNLMDSGREAWDGIKSTGLEAWDEIVQRVQAGDLQGAFEVGLAALDLMWAQTVAAFSDQWAPFLDFLNEGWKAATDVASELWAGFATYFSDAAGFLSDSWQAFTEFVGLNTGADAVGITWNDMIAGLSSVFLTLMFLWDDVWQRAENAMQSVGDFFVDVWKNAIDTVLGMLNKIPGFAKLLGTDKESLQEQIDAAKTDRDEKAKERSDKRQARLDEIEQAKNDALAELDSMREQRNEEAAERIADSKAAADAKADAARERFEAAKNFDPEAEAELEEKERTLKLRVEVLGLTEEIERAEAHLASLAENTEGQDASQIDGQREAAEELIAQNEARLAELGGEGLKKALTESIAAAQKELAELGTKEQRARHNATIDLEAERDEAQQRLDSLQAEGSPANAAEIDDTLDRIVQIDGQLADPSTIDVGDFSADRERLEGQIQADQRALTAVNGEDAEKRAAESLEAEASGSIVDLLEELGKKKQLTRDGSIGAEVDVQAIAQQTGIDVKLLEDLQGGQSIAGEIAARESASTSGTFSTRAAGQIGATSEIGQLVDIAQGQMDALNQIASNTDGGVGVELG